ncbi:relaxase/mobilization nuclease domain-containing protein [uncultured Algoriphagus sp.]|uniref:relaxase/mobilization nuclease domain-containing protein n=1 Tax=uncultured Algoriphagus sp. TaxID=417365 RepID=UPI0030ED6586|tara:strand:+ start:3138 stop:4418 length:1281 start_codon:yes stop_codon:yes gene_type:complete
MVVRINTGKSIAGILQYNELKREEGKATLMMTSGMLPGAEQLNRFQLARQFKSITDLNSRTHTNAVHISLNFSPQDQLDKQKMKVLAEEYLDGIGFGNQPYLVYAHWDAGHPHVHIVTTNIDRKGNRIETHNLGRTTSEKVRKMLEVKHVLIPAEKQDYIGPDLKSLIKPAYGELPTKAGLASVINHVLANYSFASFSEFNAVLGLFQVTAYRGEKDSLRYKNRGLIFHFLDIQGRRKGVPIKASSLYSKPTLNRLEKRYGRAIARKKAKQADVSAHVHQVFENLKARGSGSIDQFKKELLKDGIALCLVFNESGRLYGVRFVDHRSGYVFKGSEFGKKFAANQLAEHFGLAGESKAASKVSFPSPAVNKPRIKDQAMDSSPSVIELGANVLEINVGDISDSPIQGSVYPKGKRKRKRDGSNEGNR